MFIRFLSVLCLCSVLLPAAAASRPSIVVLGDSLSAAYGIPLEQGWVRLLEDRLAEAGYPHRVVNGSISGETTAGGLARLPGLLERHRPALVIVELGGNDGLRGLPLKELRGNLTKMVTLSRNQGARALLLKMYIPPNYGADYTAGFTAAFGEVAAATGAAAGPFILAPLVDRPDLFQDDGIHPTAEAQPLMLDTVWPAIREVLGEAPGLAANPPVAGGRKSGEARPAPG